MDERSERLRKRRKQSASRSRETDRSDETADGPEETADSADAARQSESAGRDGGATDGDDDTEEDRSLPVKEQQTGTYMYLPETQVKRLRRQYNVLKAEYEFEYDEEFEKNRHFYPLVVQYGLEELDELDTAQIRARLEELYG